MSRINSYDLEILVGFEMGLKLVEQNSTKSYKVFQDKYCNNYLYSYDTLIMVTFRNKGVQGFTDYFGYSATTRKHTSKFIKDYGFHTYSDLKDLFNSFDAQCLDMDSTVTEQLIKELKERYACAEGGC